MRALHNNTTMHINYIYCRVPTQSLCHPLRTPSIFTHSSLSHSSHSVIVTNSSIVSVCKDWWQCIFPHVQCDENESNITDTPFIAQTVFMLSVAVLIYNMKVVWDISHSVSVNNF